MCRGVDCLKLAVTDNDYIAGQFLWTGIDYLGEARGWPVHGSDAGLLTLAGFEKPGYYRRQSISSVISGSRRYSCTDIWHAAIVVYRL